MAQKRRFYRTTKGFNAEVLVAKAVAYTDDATYALFVANAVDGELGVFNADTNAAYALAAIAAGDRYFVALKTGGTVWRTTPAIMGPGTVKRTAYTAPVKQVTTVTIAGVIGTNFNIGDEISIKVIETTPGHEPFPTITYDYTVKAGDTPTIIATALRAQINSLTDLRNRDGQGFIDASGAAGAVILTARYFGSSFRVATPGKAYEVATVVYTTPYKEGSGYSDSVAELEVEGQIYRGITTQYPGGVFAPSDFGVNAVNTVDGTTYHIYNLTPVKHEKSPTPINQHHHYWNAVIAVPSAGGPAASLTTIFGV